MKPQRFRHKPVVIEAMQWPLDDWTTPESEYAFRAKVAAVHRWVNDTGGKTEVVYEEGGGWGLGSRVYPAIFTREGKIEIYPGDFVIRGINGEFSLCKPGVFAVTYEAVLP